MRILVSRLSQEIGGAELSARDHAHVLHEMGHSVVFVTNLRVLRNKIPQKKIRKPSIFWVHPKQLRFLLFPLLFVFNIFLCFFLLVITRPHVVNPHSRDDQIIFTLLKMVFRYRVVWKDPGDMHYLLQKTRTKRTANLYQKLYLFCIAHADGIYFLNNMSEQEVVSFVPRLRGKTKVIPSDILFENFTIHKKKKSKQVSIGAVIRLNKDKGVDVLIKSFTIVHKRYPNARLIIVGGGPLRSGLEKLAQQLELNDSILFEGEQTDTSPWYSDFDIFVQPALYEAWGRTIKEAMYFSIPIIGSNTGGIAKQITDGKNGLLFKPGDHEKLASKILMFLDHPRLRIALGKEGHKKVVKEGDFRVLAEKQIIPFLTGAK